MSNIEDSILQNPVETQLDNPHFHSATSDLSSLAADKSFNVPNKLNTKALFALILGILGLPIPFLGFVGIVLGIYAKQEIIKGKTLNNILATIGIVLGIVFTLGDILYAFSIWH